MLHSLLAGISHEADYRALKEDGSYLGYVMLCMSLRKPNGDVDCLVGFMFDISERKKQEGTTTKIATSARRILI